MRWTSLLMLLASASAWAQEAAEHAGSDVHVPWQNMFVQIINSGLLFGLLFYLLKNPVKKYFADRLVSYRELVDRAENARIEAEKTNNQIKERLAKLEAGAADNVARARSEAEELRGRMISEAKTLSTKMEQEAERTAAVELEKAKAELRRELLDHALSTAGEELKKNLDHNEQKKLQTEFVEKIGVVGG